MKQLLIFLFFFFSKIVFGQTDCAAFKTGSFIYEGLPGKVSIRTLKQQKSYNNGKLEMVWNITWADSCTYVMTLKKMHSKSYEWFHKGDRIVITITGTTKTCYTYHSVFYSTETERPIESEGEMCVQPSLPPTQN